MFMHLAALRLCSLLRRDGYTCYAPLIYILMRIKNCFSSEICLYLHVYHLITVVIRGYVAGGPYEEGNFADNYDSGGGLRRRCSGGGASASLLSIIYHSSSTKRSYIGTPRPVRLAHDISCT